MKYTSISSTPIKLRNYEMVRNWELKGNFIGFVLSFLLEYSHGQKTKMEEKIY